jgi:hypothetical protein
MGKTDRGSWPPKLELPGSLVAIDHFMIGAMELARRTNLRCCRAYQFPDGVEGGTKSLVLLPLLFDLVYQCLYVPVPLGLRQGLYLALKMGDEVLGLNSGDALRLTVQFPLARQTLVGQDLSGASLARKLVCGSSRLS